MADDWLRFVPYCIADRPDERTYPDTDQQLEYLEIFKISIYKDIESSKIEDN